MRIGPRVAFGKTPATNFFLTTTIDNNSRVLIRKVQSNVVVGAPQQVNVAPAMLGGGVVPSLAFHETFNEWLVVWIRNGGTAMGGRFVNPALGLKPVAVEVPNLPAGAPMKSGDVAAGYDLASAGRFNVSYVSNDDIFAIRLDANVVIGVPEPIFAGDMFPDSWPAIAYNPGPKQFFTVWQHQGAVSTDIYGQRHKLP